jgi:hypothetical protein
VALIRLYADHPDEAARGRVAAALAAREGVVEVTLGEASVDVEVGELAPQDEARVRETGLAALVGTAAGDTVEARLGRIEVALAEILGRLS